MSNPARTFERMKPFIKMLEGSIDEARRRRLGPDEPVDPAPQSRPGPEEAAPNRSAPAGGVVAPSNESVPVNGSSAQPHPRLDRARPLRATPKGFHLQRGGDDPTTRPIG